MSINENYNAIIGGTAAAGSDPAPVAETSDKEVEPAAPKTTNGLRKKVFHIWHNTAANPS